MTENVNETTKRAEDMGKAAFQRGKQALKASSVRHVVVRGANGKKIVDVNMTLAIVIGIVAFVLAWWLLPLIAAIGYLAKLRVEVIREVKDDDKVIEIFDA